MASAWDLALQNGVPPNDQEFLQQLTPAQRNPATVYRPAPPPPPEASLEQPQVQRKPAVAGMPRRNPASTMMSVDEIIQQQKDNQALLQGYADKYKDLTSQHEGDVDFSPILHLVDSTFGSKTATGYQKPGEKEQQDLLHQFAIQKEAGGALSPVAQELIKAYSSENSAQSRYLNNITKKDKSSANAFAKAKENILMTGRNAPKYAVQAQEKLGRVNSAMALIEAVENDPNAVAQGKYDPASMEELTSAVAGTVNNSNVVTDSMREALKIRNLPLSTAGVLQYLTGKPDPVHQKEWIARIVRTLEAEHHRANTKLEAYHDEVADINHAEIGDENYDLLKRLAKRNRDNAFPSPLSVLGVKADHVAGGTAGTVSIQDPATGKRYNIPVDQVDAFKKAKRIK